MQAQTLTGKAPSARRDERGHQRHRVPGQRHRQLRRPGPAAGQQPADRDGPRQGLAADHRAGERDRAAHVPPGAAVRAVRRDQHAAPAPARRSASPSATPPRRQQPPRRRQTPDRQRHQHGEDLRQDRPGRRGQRRRQARPRAPGQRQPPARAPARRQPSVQPELPAPARPPSTATFGDASLVNKTCSRSSTSWSASRATRRPGRPQVGYTHHALRQPGTQIVACGSQPGTTVGQVRARRGQGAGHARSPRPARACPRPPTSGRST